jgi:hypothetical protein
MASWLKVGSGLARDLRNVEFAREFIRAAIEDGLSLRAVLAKVVRPREKSSRRRCNI